MYVFFFAGDERLGSPKLLPEGQRTGQCSRRSQDLDLYSAPGSYSALGAGSPCCTIQPGNRTTQPKTSRWPDVPWYPVRIGPRSGFKLPLFGHCLCLGMNLCTGYDIAALIKKPQMNWARRGIGVNKLVD